MPGLIDGQVQGAAKPPLPQPANPKPPLPKPGAQAVAQPVGDPIVARIEIAAKKALAQPKIAQQFIALIKAAGDPVQGVAQATVTLMRQLYASSKGTMPQKAIMPAAQKVVVDVARMGAAAKLYKITPDFIQQAATATFKLMQAAYQKKMQTQQQPPPAAAQPAQPAAPPTAPAPAAAPVVQPGA